MGVLSPINNKMALQLHKYWTVTSQIRLITQHFYASKGQISGQPCLVYKAGTTVHQENMSSELGKRSPEKVVRVKAREASEDLKAHSGACSGRTTCSEHKEVWQPVLACCRELRGVSGELSKPKWTYSQVFSLMLRSTQCHRRAQILCVQNYSSGLCLGTQQQVI